MGTICRRIRWGNRWRISSRPCRRRSSWTPSAQVRRKVEAFTDRNAATGCRNVIPAHRCFSLILRKCSAAASGKHRRRPARNAAPQIDGGSTRRTTDLAHARTARCACFGAVVAYRSVATSVRPGWSTRRKTMCAAIMIRPRAFDPANGGYCGPEPQLFHMCFKQCAGTTFTKYLTGHRIRQGDVAAHRLQRGGNRAACWGTTSTSYFSAVFHRMTGLPRSPSRALSSAI